MTTRLADPEGHVTDALVAYYRARALGGVGLVTVKMGSPEKVGRHRYRELGVYDDEFNGIGFTNEWGRHLENRSKGQQA
jgi:2,4-dienoyl-CoA reductase-like NADH-dependent reductase (Old Yellow Enzyme family)